MQQDILIQNLMEIWFINLRKSLEIQTSLFFFKRIINRFKRAGYSLAIMWQIACLVLNQSWLKAMLHSFSCAAVVQASDSMTTSM